MKIDNEFTVSAPIERAWEVLTDLEGIAPCLPGAMLTGREGDVYNGKVKIKVGPVTSEYAGTASFIEKDDAAHHAVIDAKGRDSRGAGNASATITADLIALGDSTKVTVSTDLKITGKIAQFGSGMIQEVSKKLLGQFVDCLEGKLMAPADEPVSTETATAAAGSSAAASDTSAVAVETSTAATVSAPAAATPAAEAPAAPAPAPAAHRTPQAEPEALDVLALSRGALTKRLVPVAVGVAVVAAVIIYVIVR
jgi:carbon monoxide dehydrogenase subunit G